MTNSYDYALSACDVPLERRPDLESYRAKREAWVAWLDGDPDNAIWATLSQMVWTDVAFRSLSELALKEEANCLNNSLVAEKLINGHVATQVLAIRRLMDRTRGVISLRRLLTDIRSNYSVITRENYVCYDGLTYDYNEVQLAEIQARSGVVGVFWGETKGPKAWSPSQMAHEQFDRLTGIEPSNRRREDRLPIILLDRIEEWLTSSDAESLANWSHAYLAHAGSQMSREQIANVKITNDRITETIKTLTRVTEAVSAYLLYDGGRLHGLMPTPQYDQFERLDRPAMSGDDVHRVHEIWRSLSDERDVYAEGVCERLIGTDN